MRRPLGSAIVIGAFATSGAAHLARPELFEPLIPAWLGSPRLWVLGSGVAELACAAGLLGRQEWAPAASAATMVIIWVGNVQMALDVQRSARPAWQKAAAWARLPIQVPLVRAAWTSPTRVPG